MTHEQAVEFFSDLYRGAHHIPGRGHKGENVKPHGKGWCILTDGDLPSFDSNLLTRLTLMAHDRAVRVEVAPAMRYLRIAIWQRVREGGINERHPTIETAIEAHRATYEGQIGKVRA